MRIFGYNLLTLGFLWLAVWCACSIGPLTRSIGIENFKKYPEGRQYSTSEVCDAIRSVLIEYQESAHGIVLPAMLMFAGGVLLDVAGRRNKKRLYDKPSA